MGQLFLLIIIMPCTQGLLPIHSPGNMILLEEAPTGQVRGGDPGLVMDGERSDAGQDQVLAHFQSKAVKARDQDLALLEPPLGLTTKDIELPRVETLVNPMLGMTSQAIAQPDPGAGASRCGRWVNGR